MIQASKFVPLILGSAAAYPRFYAITFVRASHFPK